MLIKELIIEPHYLPVSGIFSFIFSSEEIIADDVSVFKKQTYRNRANILSANGLLSLIVPVRQGKTHLAIKDVKIDYSTSWQRIHWQSLVSAYNNSPFFEFYMDHFNTFYHKKYHFLIDLNIEILREMMNCFGLKNNHKFLSETRHGNDFHDLRNCFHPKTKYNNYPENYSEQTYIQVFSEKNGFTESLSAIDLLFNCGNMSKEYLQMP